MTKPETQSRAVRVAVLHGSDIHRHMLYKDDGEIFNKGNNDMWRLLRWANVPGVFQSKMLHLTPAYFRHKTFRWNFDRFDAIYNSISEPDQNPKVLRIAEQVIAEAGLPTLNLPKHVLKTTRHGVSATLQDLPGILMPTTLRLRRADMGLLRAQIERGNIDYPMVLRPVGTHTGRETEICRTHAEASQALSAMKGPVYATAFVNFQSADGLYRKYRFFMIGGQPVFRHLIISDQWNIHVAEIERFMDGKLNLFGEEKNIYDRGIDTIIPGVTDRLKTVNDLFNMDYIGVDCAFLNDGRMVIFEVNATMNFLPISKFDPLSIKGSCIPRATEALLSLIATRTGHTLADLTTEKTPN